MSYLVLARKYRPRRFLDLVGQEHVAKTLTNAIALDRVHHAFLLTGARGVGKTSSARILAMALTCEKGPTPDPCGECPICSEIASGQSVDVLEIDGASNTGVDDVRTLREGVKYAPSRARKKVYIIDEVHMLSTSAFNALLKTLEEPPSHVVFILATTEVHKIPATIMSRVQRYDFKLVPTGRLVEHLAHVLDAEGVKYELDGLRIVAKQAGGSVRDSLSLLDQVIAFVGDEPITADLAASVLGLADTRLLFTLGNAVLQKDVALAVRTLADALNRGVDLTQLARHFLTFLHDLEMVALLSNPQDVVDLTMEEIVEAKNLASKLTPPLIQTLFDRWARAVEESGRSSSARLVCEMALVDLCLAEPLLPLGDLLGRLEGLESKLAGAPIAASSAGANSLAPVRRAMISDQPSSPRNPPAFQPPAPAAAAQVTVALAAPQNDVPAATIRTAEPLQRPKSTGPNNLSNLWRDVKESIARQSPMIAAALEHAALTSASEGQLSIVMSEKFQCDQIEKNRAKIEATLLEVSGVVYRLEVRQGDTRSAAVPSSVRAEAVAADNDKRNREEEARKHPMIQKAQDVFGAKVTGIKT
jgi:DNA polymerase III subunit gamma/tau